jgi:hypothetical protein
MPHSSGEAVILMDAFFILLLGLYGFTTGPPALSAFQNIPTPTLAPLPGSIHCAFWDYICSSSKDIVQATAYVGWAIVNLPVIIIYAVIVVITFADMILSIVFSPDFSSHGVPVLGFLFTAFQFFVLFDAMRFFRGNGVGQ